MVSSSLFDRIYSWAVSADVSALVGWAGTILGVVGLLMTIAVYKSTASIRREFLISVRVPSQLKDISACASVISSHMNGSNLESPELKKEVARLAVIAESLRLKISARETKRIVDGLKVVETLAISCEKNLSANSLTELWIKTQASLEALSQWKQDRDWRSNGD